MKHAFQKSKNQKSKVGRGSKARRLQRGMGSVVTMLVLLSLLSIALLGALSSSGRMSSGASVAGDNALTGVSARLGNDDAYNLAEAGIEYTRAWLITQPLPPTNTAAFAPTLWGGTIAGTTPPRSTVKFPDSVHTFSVTIYPDVNNNQPNQQNVQVGYLVESIGVSSGKTVILQAYFQQNSFSRYALFIDNGLGGYWGSDTRSFDGPVHINSGPVQGDNWGDQVGGGQPVFADTYSDAFTVSMSSVPFQHNGANNSPPQTAADWAMVSGGGANSVQTNAPAIPMPTVNYIQQYAALGQTPANPNSPPNPSTLPMTTGATISPGGGIYVHGAVTQMTLSATGPNNTDQVITIYQTDGSGNKIQTILTLNPQTNQTTQQVTTTPLVGPTTNTTTTYSGTTNGVIYSDGSIGGQGSPLTGGLSGTIADNVVDSYGNITHLNALTITTDQSKNVNIDNSIVTNTKRQISTQLNNAPTYHASNGTLTNTAANNTPVYVPESTDTQGFVQHAGRLGVVTNTVEVLDKTYNTLGTTSTGNLATIEVDAAVLTTGTYELYNNSTRATHNFLNMGSYIIGHGAQVSSITRGYDDRLAYTAPPYFPTASNTYTLQSWQRVTKTLEP
jgi:hypothetical protein